MCSNTIDSDMSDGWIVVDTDCGTDDAMALTLALGRRKRVWAITCCAGNTTVDNACANVLRVLNFCGTKQIPVYRGSRSAYLHPKTKSIEDVHGADGFGNCSELYPTGDLRVVEGESAAEALVRMSRTRPHQITLVALAPLTNIALAHKLDPGFTGRLKSIICMGGNYTGLGNITETAEFNFFYDPEAANIVLTEASCPITLVPWETTIEYGIEWDLYESLMNTSSHKSRFLKNITAFVAEYCRKEKDPRFLDCDFLAMVAALEPDAVKTVLERHLVVECAGQYTRGMVICKRDPPEMANRIKIVEHFNWPILHKLRTEMITD